MSISSPSSLSEYVVEQADGSKEGDGDRGDRDESSHPRSHAAEEKGDQTTRSALCREGESDEEEKRLTPRRVHPSRCRPSCS